MERTAARVSCSGYVSLEQRIPADIRSGRCRPWSSRSWLTCRPGSPEQLLLALLLQVLYPVHSERQLLEQLDFILLYRWFVGPADECLGVAPEDLHEKSGTLAGDIAAAALGAVLWLERLPAP